MPSRSVAISLRARAVAHGPASLEPRARRGGARRDAGADGVGWPPPDSVPVGDGEPEPDSEPTATPTANRTGDPDWATASPTAADGEPDCGEPDWGEPDCGDGEPDWGGGLPEPPVGGGGVCGGWLRKIRIAISTASAASSSISSQDTRMVRQPARS